jgi:cytoskeletal protein CcmA (bactofilin family)
MGRSGRTEPTSELQSHEDIRDVSNNLYGIQTGPNTVNRAMSDSESMARDIKEGRLSGFIGSGTVLTGDTGFHAMLRIDGHLTGKITSEAGTLIIGSTGRVDANVVVACAMISGAVNGDIIGAERVELGRTARVVGNIHTPRLVIEDGAVFEGSCSMLKATEAKERRNEEEKKRGVKSAPPEISVSDAKDDDDDLIETSTN